MKMSQSIFGKLINISLTAGLAVLALGYLLVGTILYYDLPVPAVQNRYSRWDFAAPVDVQYRWLECNYVRRGVNPCEVKRGEKEPHRGLATARLHKSGQQIDMDSAVGNIGYAPWSYTFGELFLLPYGSLHQSLYWFGFLNAVSWFALIASGYYAARLSGLSGLACIGVGSAGVASSGVMWAFTCGNYGIVVVALLAGGVWLLHNNRPLLAGVCLGFAMIKPQLATLFFLIPLVRRQYGTFVVGSSLVLGPEWTVTCVRLHRPPLFLLLELFEQGSTYIEFLRFLRFSQTGLCF